jgi:hypothetical protein
LGHALVRRPRTAPPSRPSRPHQFPVDFTDRLGVGRVLVTGHQAHQPSVRAPVEVLDQGLRQLCRAAADHDADDQAMLRVQGDMVPAVAAEEVVGMPLSAMLFLLADKGPLLVELDFIGPRGKKPRVHRGVVWRGRLPAGCSG